MASKPIIECYHCRLVNFVDGTETKKRWFGDIPPVGYLQLVAKQLQADLYYLTWNYRCFDPTVERLEEDLKLLTNKKDLELYSTEERIEALPRWQRLRAQIKWSPEVHEITKFWSRTTPNSIQKPALRPCPIAARKAIWRHEFETTGGNALSNQKLTFEMVGIYQQVDKIARRVEYENQQKERSGHGKTTEIGVDFLKYLK